MPKDRITIFGDDDSDGISISVEQLATVSKDARSWISFLRMILGGGPATMKIDDGKPRYAKVMRESDAMKLPQGKDRFSTIETDG